MLRASAATLALILVALMTVPAPATAYTVVCVGPFPANAVCIAYAIVVEAKDGHVFVSIIDTKNQQTVAAVCIEPPDIWLGDCDAGPPSGGERILILP